MNLETVLRRHPPNSLGRARAMAHRAVQLPTRAARANLPVKPDDSQSNLGWDHALNGFLSQPLKSDAAICFVGVSIFPLEVRLVCDDQPVAALAIKDISEIEACSWLDVQLEQVGLKSAVDVTLPYDLPPEVSEITVFKPGAEAEALESLSAWFGLAHNLLSELAADVAELTPGPSPVRCWPHHFDIATYISLEAGDSETAKGIGVGMSPGDETYDQPYFYINPWPHLKPDDLPDLPPPGHWHKDGFVGAIATADEVLSSSDFTGTLRLFVDGAFTIGRNRLGFE